MIRTQVQFTDDQLRRLRREAKAQGISVAELIRRLIEQGMEDTLADRAALYERALGFVGAFRDRDNASDVSERHDSYLEEAFG